MRNGTFFLIIFVVSYLLISLPEILGIGWVVDWIEKPTLLMRCKAYVMGGLTSNWLTKGLLSFCTGLVSVVVKVRKNQTNEENH